jgi:hypothetical protein
MNKEQLKDKVQYLIGWCAIRIENSFLAPRANLVQGRTRFLDF